MTLISDITPQKKAGRSNVFLDEKFWTGMPDHLIAEHNLRPGAELSPEQQEQIQIQIAEEDGMAYAMLLLSYRDRSQTEIRRKMSQRKLAEGVIGHTIDRLLEYGYLDDQRFALELAQSQLERGRGRRAAQSALYKAGLEGEIITQALDQVYHSEASEISAALIWLGRKKLPQDAADRQKLLRGLAGRGFSFDVARQALEQWERED